MIAIKYIYRIKQPELLEARLAIIASVLPDGKLVAAPRSDFI